MNKKINEYYKINWAKAHQKLILNQETLVEAIKRQKPKQKIHQLQRKIVTSFSARALAVRKIVMSSGKKTPGIDKEVWDTPIKRMEAIKKLKFIVENPKTYKASPVKRIFISKKDSMKKRPLGIPTMIDRAVQALYLFSIDPIVECNSDYNSYGFRKYRNAHYAISKLRHLLEKDWSPRYILDADIEQCFDKILHETIIEKTIISDKSILKQWLKSGIKINNEIIQNAEGVPQGGVISPVLCNIVLNGMEEYIKKKGEQFHKEYKEKKSQVLSKIHVIRYADDFIVTAEKREILELLVPKINSFLEKKGLKINETKKKIKNIYDGFEFLGFNIYKRKYNPKLNAKNKSKERLIIKPSKSKIKLFKRMIKEELSQTQKPFITVISRLNPKLIGWANYFRINYHATREFHTLSYYVWIKIRKWLRKKHTKRNDKWINDKYIEKSKYRTKHWCVKTPKQIFLTEIGTITALKINHYKNEQNPYTKEGREYFEKRKWLDYKGTDNESLRKKIIRSTNGKCLVCGESLLNSYEPVELHHIKPLKMKGTWKYENLVVLHEQCHKQVTYNKELNIKIAHIRKNMKNCPSRVQ